MVIAQALGEYAGAASIAAFFATSVSTVRTFFTGISTETWVLIAGAVFLAFFVRNLLK